MKTNNVNILVVRSFLAASFLTLLTTSNATAERLSVMVVDFTSSVKTNYQTRLPELIVDEIVNSGVFEVVERDKLTSIAEEFSLQAGAFVNPDKAVEIGGMVGAQLMLTGNIVENWHSKDTVEAYGIRSTIHRSYLKARIELVDLKTGVKIFSNVADDGAELKKTGAHSVGRGSTSLGPRVAGKLVNALLENKNVNEMISAANGDQVEMVSIEINSVPEGADVEIDGVFMGNAGGRFDIKPGIHEISVSLTGYEPWSKKVKVKEGLSFTATLAELVDQRIELQIQDQSN